MEAGCGVQPASVFSHPDLGPGSECEGFEGSRLSCNCRAIGRAGASPHTTIRKSGWPRGGFVGPRFGV